MSKHRSPAPGFDDAIRHLEGAVPLPGFVMACIYPSPRDGQAFVSVDVCVSRADASYKIVKRWGESVPLHKTEVVQGAVFRACFQAGQWLSSMSKEELVKYLRWQADVL